MRMVRRRGLPFICFVCVGTMGCTGSIDGGATMPPSHTDGDDAVDPVQTPETPALHCSVSPIGPVTDVPARLMTALELNAAVAALLPHLDLAPVVMSLDSRVETFLLNAREAVNERHLQDLRLWAESVAKIAAENPDKVYDCPTEDAAHRVCAEGFLIRLAERAFRRSLDGGQTERIKALYVAGFDADGVRGGLRYTLEAILQAPSFTYVHEGAHRTSGVFDLSQHEIAQRLASTFLRSIPDDELLADAVAGVLADPDVRALHARRLLDSPRGKLIQSAFIMQWLGLDAIADQPFAADAQGQSLAEAMTRESRAFINYVVEDRGGRWRELFDAPYTFVDETMAAHYEVDLAGAEPLGTGYWKTTLPDRVGLLTQAGFLALKHGPIHRGLAVRKAVLCGEVPGPEGIDVMAIPTEPEESERSKVEKRLAMPGCGACHRMMDPLGLTFDPYDALGRRRSQDAYGNPVSGAGQIFGTEAHDGPVANARAMIQTLVKTDEARRCVARQLFVWTFARVPAEQDESRITALNDALVAGGDHLAEALVSVVRNPTFAQGCGKESL